LVPASDGGDDFVGIGDPLERLRVGVVVVKEAIDRGLQSVTDRRTPRLRRRLGRTPKKPSTAMSHEADVGVKWKVQRG
jgi:hypothetical protein